MTHEFATTVFIGLNIFIFIWLLVHKLQFAKHVNSEIKRAVEAIKSVSFEERGTLRISNHLKSSFKNSSLLYPFWESYYSTLVATDPILQEPIFSCQESSDFFNIESMMENSSKLVSFSIWNAVPQILTSVGIIGTFTSILLSLDIKLGGIDIDFIYSLVRSLATGFKSSLVGIGLAVAFIIFEKVQTKGINKSLSNINKLLSKFYPKLNAEMILVQQKHILEHLSVDIQTSIANGFTEMSGGLGSALADVLDEETKDTIKKGISASFLEMNAVLIEIRNESKVLTEELNLLKDAKKEIYDNIRSITEDQNKIQKEINSQSANLVDQLQALEKTMAPLGEVAKQIQSTNELSGALIQSVNSVSEASIQIRTSLSKSEELSISTFDKINDLNLKLSNEYSGLGTNIENWVTQSNTHVENNMKEFDKNVGGVLKQVLSLSDQLHVGVQSLERTVDKLGLGDKVIRET